MHIITVNILNAIDIVVTVRISIIELACLFANPYDAKYKVLD